ncbi:LamG-like jellyroll fold domain-containing protein [Roseateles sp.]|uniref:LamG-like jellyroll fold domain-containing protein n=1 Tax=Roseateles sp. TaxID=1971397 RepID=UPI0032650B0E
MTATHEPLPPLARRSLLAGLGLLPALPLLRSAPAHAETRPVPASTSGVFRHAGLLITDDDFKRIRGHIAAGQQPWTGWWNRLCTDRATSLDLWPGALPAVYRQDNSKHSLYRDIYRAWCMALRWKLSDDPRYADKAVQFLDAWANTLKVVGTVPPGSTAHDDHTFILMAGMQGHQFAQIGEIMRTYPGWAPASLARFQQMLLEVFGTICSGFLNKVSLGSHANWDIASLCGAMAIGVFCDRPELYRQACDYYAGNNRGKLATFGNGSIVHSVYFMHPGHFGQWEESGRDQGHSTLGMSLGGNFLEMAWNQGDDLYGMYNNRFLAAAEYVARSNLKDESGNVYAMPYAAEQNPPEPHPSRWTQVNQSFQHQRNAWEPIYNHYVNRMGLAAPNVARMVEWCEPNNGGSSDDVAYATLTHRRPAYAGPMKPPSGLTVHLRDGRAVLSWWGSVGATSYVVKRAARANGPFTHLTTIPASELLTHTDAPPKGVWFYQVTALGSASVSVASAAVRVAVPGEPRFSMPLNGSNNTGTFGGLQSPAGKWEIVKGELLGAAAWADGRLNDKAIAFDGKSSGLQLPPGIFSNLDDFTLSLWANANSLRTDTALFYAGHDSYSYMRLLPKGRVGLQFAISGAGFNDEQSLVAPAFMPIRRWVHLAVTLQGTTGRLYVDGTEVARSDYILLSPRQVGDQVAFLGRSWGHAPFDGRIQGFRVEAGALSAAEVAALAM